MCPMVYLCSKLPFTWTVGASSAKAAIDELEFDPENDVNTVNNDYNCLSEESTPYPRESNEDEHKKGLIHTVVKIIGNPIFLLVVIGYAAQTGKDEIRIIFDCYNFSNLKALRHSVYYFSHTLNAIRVSHGFLYFWHEYFNRFWFFWI